MTTPAPFTPYCRTLIEQQGWDMVNDRATRARICMAWAINAFETTEPEQTPQRQSGETGE